MSSPGPSKSFEYVFPAIRGVQAGREYYVSMCPMKLIPRIFLFNEEELVPELRAQRVLNKARIPEIARYLLTHPKDYCFSAITASIDGDVTFESFGEEGDASRLGSLRVPMSARFIINDGQHRRAAIEAALRETPDLADETIAVVFFLDVGLERCQQMFADLNRYAIRPTRSLGILYDHRDELGRVVKDVASKSVAFRDVVEMERSTLSARSLKLFTLSAIYTATSALLAGAEGDAEELTATAIEFWDEIAKHFPEWRQVKQARMPASEVRRDFIHSHGIALHALARVGHTLLRDQKRGWKKRLSALKTLNWSRSNTRLWEGRALVGGRVSKSGNNVVLTTNAIKKHLGVELTAEEQRIETAHGRGGRDKQRQTEE